MKKRQIRVIAASLTAAVLLTSPIYSDNSATDATVQSYEDRLADAAAKQEAALDELDRIRNEQSNVWDELNQYDTLINITSGKKEVAEKQLESIYAQIEDKEAEILRTTESIENQEEAFLNRMVANYMDGDASYLEILLGAESLVDFLTRMDRIEAILESDKAIVAGLKADKEALLKAQNDLEAAKELQKTTISDYEQAIQETVTLSDAKYERLQELQSDEENKVALYWYYKDEEEKLNSELETYLAELQKKSQSVYVGGSLAWPLDPSAYYYYSSEFGGRWLYGAWDNHLGLDIACAQNTKILAANSGTVLISESHWSYGNYVLIDHGGGTATLYAHMTSRAVSAGDYVTTGQCIGYVGMTGSATGFHLHFEVRENGTVQNPRGYIVGPSD